MSTKQKAKTARPATIPEGYMEDAHGRLCPVETIPPIDLTRDELVKELLNEAKAMHKALTAFKSNVFMKADDFVALSAAQYGASLGGKKGNVTLTSFDGRFKVLLATSETVTFDERLQAAKALIDDCLNEWTENSKPELQTIVTRAFQTDGEGRVSVGLVLSLRRYEITDKRWQTAMKAIGESLQVVGSKRYVRFYEKLGDSDAYVPISIDVASV